MTKHLENFRFIAEQHVFVEIHKTSRPCEFWKTIYINILLVNLIRDI
jgi:hypothetical protein